MKLAQQQLPPLDFIKNAVLRDKAGQEVHASELWREQPMVIYLVRRPGCVLCRAEAQRLWGLQPQLQELGVGLAAVLHEWQEPEVAAFSPAFWPGPLYHDTDKVLYRALNGCGPQPLRASLLSLLNPWGPVWGRIREAQASVKDSNLVGDGFTLGGLLVVGAGDAGVTHMHVEREIGAGADTGAVMDAARRAAALAREQPQPQQQPQ